MNEKMLEEILDLRRRNIAWAVYVEAVKTHYRRQANPVPGRTTTYALASPEKLLARMGYSHVPELASVDSHVQVADIANGLDGERILGDHLIMYSHKDELFIATL